MPLAFDPGQEAQVDWHEAWIIDNGYCPSIGLITQSIIFSISAESQLFRVSFAESLLLD